MRQPRRVRKTFVVSSSSTLIRQHWPQPSHSDSHSSRVISVRALVSQNGSSSAGGCWISAMLIARVVAHRRGTSLPRKRLDPAHIDALDRGAYLVGAGAVTAVGLYHHAVGCHDAVHAGCLLYTSPSPRDGLL